MSESRRHVDWAAVRTRLGERCFVCVDLQRVLHRVGEAIRRVVPTERLYVCSLGSQQANRHVHWHLAPLPPGVPFEEQQLVALGRSDVLDLTEAEFGELAARVRAELRER